MNQQVFVNAQFHRDHVMYKYDLVSLLRVTTLPNVTLMYVHFDHSINIRLLLIEGVVIFRVILKLAQTSCARRMKYATCSQNGTQMSAPCKYNTTTIELPMSNCLLEEAIGVTLQGRCSYPIHNVCCNLTDPCQCYLRVHMIYCLQSCSRHRNS